MALRWEDSSVRIRYEDKVFDLNDYHFLHLFRNVNAGTIHTSKSDHVVVTGGFQDWNGLAKAASQSKVADFKYGGYAWHKEGAKEIYPVDGPGVLRLSKLDLETLTAYLNDDVAVPNQPRSADFAKALTAVTTMRTTKPTTKLAIQWPTVLPKGFNHSSSRDYTAKVAEKPAKGRKAEEEEEVPVIQHFLWGPNGNLEFPHIHCFVNAAGNVYLAKATLRPQKGSTSKRYAKFLDNLKVDESETLTTDREALDELMLVMCRFAFGEDLPVAAPARNPRKAVQQSSSSSSEETVDPLFETYARKHHVEEDWIVAAAIELEMSAAEIVDYDPQTVQTMLEMPKG